MILKRSRIMQKKIMFMLHIMYILKDTLWRHIQLQKNRFPRVKKCDNLRTLIMSLDAVIIARNRNDLWKLYGRRRRVGRINSRDNKAVAPWGTFGMRNRLGDLNKKVVQKQPDVFRCYSHFYFAREREPLKEVRQC